MKRELTSIERLALLGDEIAQKECSDQGIALPCPCCGGDPKIEIVEVDDSCHFLKASIYCTNCNVEISSCIIHPSTRREDCNNDIPIILRVWNSRVPYPVGICKDCQYWDRDNSEFIEGYLIANCMRWSNSADEHYEISSSNDFCNYFKPISENKE